VNWNELSYDEQRALLGLPDVRRQVAWMRVQLAWARVGRAFSSVEAAASAAEYALAGVK
jgi:hypothetical protein